jgi:hypothetical protein
MIRRVVARAVALGLGLALTTVIAPRRAQAQFVADQVTAGNAATLLFGGTDADGGVGDWYVSNGVVEAIIDEVGPQTDLVALLGAAAPPKQSEAAFSGGSIIDLGRAGAHNDQLGQLFTVGGLSTSNFIVYDGVSAATDLSSATVTVTGGLLGFEPAGVPPSSLPVVTEYRAAGADPFLTVTTTVTNVHPSNTAPGLGGFLDAIIWTQRAIVPFSPLANRGFRHAILDFESLGDALELPPFAAGPGNVGPGDGVMDPPSGRAAGEVAYGILGVTASVDIDGPGPASPIVNVVDSLFGVSSNLVTALGNFPMGDLPPGGVLTYTRRLYVGDRNDVASVANGMIAAIATRRAFATGTVSGDVGATDTPDVAASAIATKIGEICTQGTTGAACTTNAACDAAPLSSDGRCSSTPGFESNSPVTHFRTAPRGAFGGIVLPTGRYRLEFRAVNRDAVTVTPIGVLPATDTAVSVPAMTGLGTLRLRILERRARANAPFPAKVTVKGIAGTPDPSFRKDFEALGFRAGQPDVDLAPETFAGGPAQRNFVYVGDGTETVALRPGRYELYASRGPEYTVRRRRVRIIEGGTRRRRLKIRRIVDTAGRISGDFHIHSARSFDTSPPLRDRVASFAGEGVEVMVSTDHDYHTDYATVIAGMGLSARITSIPGNEITTSVPNPPAFPSAIGHINAWPVPVDPTARRDGSIEDEYVAPNFIFSRLRAQGADVIQYNHPRAGVSGLTSIGFFSNLGCNRCANDVDTTCVVDTDCPAAPTPQNCTCVGYQPDRPITQAPNDTLLDDDITGISGVANPDGIRNLDFDVMEIANGIDIASYLAVRRDWLSLLNQTDFATVPFIAGTAVSDSHRLVLEEAGYFRTYVGGAGNDPATLDVDAFNANVVAGNMIGTSGPFVDFSVEDTAAASAGPGGILAPATSTVTLRIRVQATNWIPVEEVRVIVNGFVDPALVFDATTSPAVTPGPSSPLSQFTGRVVRFDAAIPVAVSGGDAYFIVEAGAKLDPLPTAPSFVNTIVPGVVPLAFTNPVFVDLDGDGFDPPGLPVMASARDTTSAPSRFVRVERRERGIFARARAFARRLLARIADPSRAVAGESNEFRGGAPTVGAPGAATSNAAQAGAPARGHAVDPLASSDGAAPAADTEPETTVAPPTRQTGEAYFPLYEFRIPESAVEEAIDTLPEPERQRIRRQRERARSR